MSLKAEESAGLPDYDGHFNAEDYIDKAPDGGYGWVCCGAVSAMNFATWGANSSFGVMLSYYLESGEFAGATPTMYSLMVGLVMFFTLATISLSSIMMFKFGYRITVSTGIVMQLGAYIGASFARSIGQLIALQGILLGLGIGVIFGANSIVLPGWFLHKRAVAVGISQAGIGLGGITFSLMTNAMIDRTGDQRWVLRALGIISFVICTSMMFVVRIRVSSADTRSKNDSLMTVLRSVFDFRVLKSFPLQLITFWSSIATMGYVICLFSLSNYAVSIGLNATQATIITVAFNLAQAIGRPLTGYLCEVFGRINFSIIGTGYTSLLVFVWWINVHNYASLVAFSLFLGMFVGVGSVSWSPLVVDVVGMNAFPAACSWATLWMAAFSLASELIAISLRDYSIVGQSPYFHCQIFVGVLYFVAMFFLIPYREWRVKRMVSQMKDSKTLNPGQRLFYEHLNESRSVGAYMKRAFLPVKI